MYSKESVTLCISTQMSTLGQRNEDSQDNGSFNHSYEKCLVIRGVNVLYIDIGFIQGHECLHLQAEILKFHSFSWDDPREPYRYDLVTSGNALLSNNHTVS